MRLLTTTLLSLSACVLAVHSAPVAEAKPKPKRVAVQKAVKKAPTETLKPLVLLNPDGTPRSPTLDDAPASDDYQLVAWCHGALSGNMDIAEKIDSIEPVDERIQSIGRSYLRAYEAALTLSGKGKTPEGFALAETARQHGFNGWNGAREADLQKAAYAYVTWQLPSECERAAIRLSGHPNLFAELATEDEARIIAETLNSGGERGYAELPQPKLTAQVAPEDPNAPVSANTLGRRVRQSLPLPKAPAGNAAETPAGSN